jgi:hypothetical protein
MRDWKNNDKFTAQDYVDERDGITSEIETLDIQLQEIRGDKLILSDRPPDVEYDDYLWMDPQVFNFFYEHIDATVLNYESSTTSAAFLKKGSVLCDVCLDYSSSLVWKYFQREYGEVQDAAFSYESTTTSNKVQKLSSDFVANIIYESGVESYKMPQFKSDFEATINYNSETTSYKMPQFKSTLEDVSFDYSSNIINTAEILASSAFEIDINYSSEIIGYKMPQLSSSMENVAFDYSSNTTSTVEILASSAFEAEVTYSSDTTAYKTPEFKSTLEDVAFSYSSQLEGNARQFSESAFEVEINYSSTLEGSPRQFSESGMQNITLTYNSDTVSAVSYSVYARNTAGPPLQMTVQFQGESAYSTSVSGISDTLLREGMISSTSLGITAPQSLAQGPVTYVFNRWEVNGVTQTPISNTLIVDLETTTYLVAYYDEFIN